MSPRMLSPYVLSHRAPRALLLASLLSGCLQDNPLFGTDTQTTGAGPSTGDAPPDPTTGPGASGDTTSTGDDTTGPTRGTGSLTSSSGEDDGSGTTTLSFPLCPYAPDGVEVSLTSTVDIKDEDLTVRPCGTAEVFGPLRSELGFEATGYQFLRCKDEACGDCDVKDRLALGFIVPDPWGSAASGLAEGACAQLRVVWDRPVEGEGMLCAASTIALVELSASVPAEVPTMLFHRGRALPAADVVDDFQLAAEVVGPGGVGCDCEADCCREAPGSRVLGFTATVGGTQVKVEPLESEQALQDLPLGEIEGKRGTGELALVRAFFPSECGGLPEYEWIFGRKG